MPNNCIVCGCSKAKDHSISLYRIPKCADTQKKWLDELKLNIDDITSDSRVCSRHFRDGNPKTIPSIHIGIKFSECPSLETPRGKRRLSRESEQHSASKRPCIHTSSPDGNVTPISPSSISPTPEPQLFPSSPTSSLTFSGSEFDSSSISVVTTSGSSMPTQSQSDVQVTVNIALASQVEILKSENQQLKLQLNSTKPAPFRLESISHNDSLMSLYTGLPSYDVLLSFYKFLGPAVKSLQYWGTKPKIQARRRMKLDPLNQLFMTLMKLKLDVNVRDIAFRFNISTSTVSRYFITWVCFLYHEFHGFHPRNRLQGHFHMHFEKNTKQP